MTKLREVNLELGLPRADDAVKRLMLELRQTCTLGCTALKVIHGYGSSGTGGRIRVEARAYLERLKQKGDIKDYITGERFSIFDSATLAAFRQCDDLRRDRDLERHNNGVTFILL